MLNVFHSAPSIKNYSELRHHDFKFTILQNMTKLPVLKVNKNKVPAEYYVTSSCLGKTNIF